MSAVGNAEVANLAALGEVSGLNKTETFQSVNKRLTAEQQNILGKVDEQIQEKNAEQALSFAATEFQHGRDWQQRAEIFALSGHDATGKRVDKEVAAGKKAKDEEGNLKVIKERTVMYQTLVGQGYDTLSATDQTTVRQETINFIKTNPFLVTLFESRRGKIDDAKVEQFLRTQGFRDAVADRLNAFYGDQNKQAILDLETAFNTAATERKKKENEKKAKTDEKASLEKAVTDTEAKRNVFDTDPSYTSASTGLGTTTKKDALVALDADSDLTDYKARLDAVRSAQQAHDKNPGGANASVLKTANDALQAYIKEPSNSGKLPKINEYNSLRNESEGLDRNTNQAQQALKTRAIGLDKDIADMDIELAQLVQDERDAKDARETTSQYYADEAKQLVFNAVREHFKTKAQPALADVKQLVAEAQTKAQTEAETAAQSEVAGFKTNIEGMIQGKYLAVREVKNPDWRPWMHVPELNPKKIPEKIKVPVADSKLINTDRKILFDPKKGPDAVLNDMFLNAVCPGANANGRCTDTSAQSKLETLRKDPAYMQEARGKLLLTFVSRMKDSGVKPTEDELTYIATSPEFSPTIEALAERNEKVKQAIDQAKAAGLISFDSKHPMKDVIKRYGLSAGIPLVLLALGLFTGFGTSAGALASFGKFLIR